MSDEKRVDVLAVMDRDRRLLSAALTASDRSSAILREHDEARNAVAELIKAAQAVVSSVDPQHPYSTETLLKNALANLGAKP